MMSSSSSYYPPPQPSPSRVEGEMVCWGITSGQAGMVAQVKALAAGLGITPLMKTIDLRLPFRYVPSMLFASLLRKLIVPNLIAPGSDAAAPPYPDVIISCGRRGALVAMGIKAKAPRIKVINIQDPKVSPDYFDLVIAMQHDDIVGSNVVKTRFALFAITPERLLQAQKQFAPLFDPYPSPRITVLLGGSTHRYALNAGRMEQVIQSLKRLQETSKGSLLITPSRRTGKDNIQRLQQAFKDNKNVYVYDMTGENPYMGMLAFADVLVVTNDSVNMMSEAYGTQKPLYLLPLPGHENTRPARFAQQLVDDSIARILGDSLESWDYAVANEMDRLVGEVRKRMRLEGAAA